MNYQYQVDSTRYPASAVDTYPRAHAMVQRVCNSSKQYASDSAFSLINFKTSWAPGLANTNSTLAIELAKLMNGTLMLSYDFSAFESNDLTGIRISPQSAVLHVNFSTVASAATMSTVVLRGSSLYAKGGSVYVEG